MGIETAIALGIGSAVAGIGGMVAQNQGGNLAEEGGQVGAAGAIASGVATNQTDQYNASVDQVMGAEALDAGAAKSQDYLRKGSDTVEGAVASQGASGVTGAGSPLLVDEDTVRQVALGASRINADARLQAGRYTDDANLQTFAGKNAIAQSYVDANTSLLGGAAGRTSADAAMWSSAGSILSQGSKFANPSFGKTT